MDIFTSLQMYLGILLIVIIILSQAIKILREYERGVIFRLGRLVGAKGPGLILLIPIVDRMVRVSLRIITMDVPAQEVITKDNVVVTVDAVIYYEVTDPFRVLYNVYLFQLSSVKLAQTNLRNIIGELELDGTLTSREMINTRLREVLDEATDKWGVKVNRVELQDINPPEDIRAAMEKQMRAERDKRAAILEAEGKKTAAILESEGIRESEVNKAEGDKKAKILIAEGEAEARIKVAQAEAEAITKITKSIAESKGDPANYLIAVRYIETLKEMVSGKENKVVYLPYEATGILSSIGGIKDMLEGVKKG